MYSDEWIKNENITRCKTVKLNSIANYYTWVDRNDGLIGISINFENADDTHYEMLARDWYSYQEKVLRIPRGEDYTAALADATSKGWLDFVTQLQDHDILYRVIAYGDD